MNLPDLAWVGLAGAAGALARFGLDAAVRQRVAIRLPIGTAIVNLSGSFVLGLLTGLVLARVASSELTLVAGTGFCGGYTTFSTASFETVRLARGGERRAAAAYLALSVGGTLVAGAVGLAVGLA